MTRLLAVTLTVLLLSACSLNPLDIAKSAITGPPSLEAELTIGDKQEDINTEVGTTNQSQEAQVINNVQELDKFLLLIAVLGWLLPSPGEMWRGLLTLLPWVRRGS